MSENTKTRDDLAEVLMASEARQTSFTHYLSYHEQTAADLRAAGYVKQRTVTTEAEVNDLPSESVLCAADGTVYRRAVDGLGAVWRAAGSGRNRFPDSILLPATVLFEGDAS